MKRKISPAMKHQQEIIKRTGKYRQQGMSAKEAYQAAKREVEGSGNMELGLDSGLRAQDYSEDSSQVWVKGKGYQPRNPSMSSIKSFISNKVQEIVHHKKRHAVRPVKQGAVHRLRAVQDRKRKEAERLQRASMKRARGKNPIPVMDASLIGYVGEYAYWKENQGVYRSKGREISSRWFYCTWASWPTSPAYKELVLDKRKGNPFSGNKTMFPGYTVAVYDKPTHRVGGKIEPIIDRYTVVAKEKATGEIYFYGMSENAGGFNLFVGDTGSGLRPGPHLGKKLKTIPEGIIWAIKDRLTEDNPKKRKKNPGAAWHKEQEEQAEHIAKLEMKQGRIKQAHRYEGMADAHRDSAAASRSGLMNPIGRTKKYSRYSRDLVTSSVDTGAKLMGQDEYGVIMGHHGIPKLPSFDVAVT